MWDGFEGVWNPKTLLQELPGYERTALQHPLGARSRSFRDLGKRLGPPVRSGWVWLPAASPDSGGWAGSRVRAGVSARGACAPLLHLSGAPFFQRISGRSFAAIFLSYLRILVRGEFLQLWTDLRAPGALAGTINYAAAMKLAMESVVRSSFTTSHAQVPRSWLPRDAGAALSTEFCFRAHV